MKQKRWKLGKHVNIGQRLAGSMRLNPYPKYMGAHSPSLWRNPASAVKAAFVHPVRVASLVEMAGAVAGAVGTYALPTRWLVAKIPVIGHWKLVQILLGNTVNIAALGTAANMAFRNRPAVSRNVVLGGLTMTGLQLLGLAISKAPAFPLAQKLSPATAMAGLGADNNVLRAKVQAAVARKLMDGRTTPAFELDGRTTPAFELAGRTTPAFELAGRTTPPFELGGNVVRIGEEGDDNVSADTM